MLSTDRITIHCCRRSRYASPSPVASFDVQNPIHRLGQPLRFSPPSHGPTPATAFPPPLANFRLR